MHAGDAPPPPPPPPPQLSKRESQQQQQQEEDLELENRRRDVNEKIFRLDGHLEPLRYDLEIDPDADNSVFTGSITIRLRVVKSYDEPTSVLTLHALNLLVEAADVSISPAMEKKTRNNDDNGDGYENEKNGEGKLEIPAPLPTMEASELPIMAALSVTVNEPSETISITFEGELPNRVGDEFHLIIARYTGTINSSSDCYGLYHSHVEDKRFLATHFEPANARYMYPCFDEPHLKAVFQLTVVYDARYSILSNTHTALCEMVVTDDQQSQDSNSVMMPVRLVVPPSGGSLSASYNNGSNSNACAGVANYEPSQGFGSSPASTLTTPRRPGLLLGGSLQMNDPLALEGSLVGQSAVVANGLRRRVTFKETPLISTYLVAFATGLFHVLERYTKKREVLCRVIFPSIGASDNSNTGWYALDLLVKAIEFYEDFFDVPLPLEKVDIVGLQAFQVLGMENWGMLTFHLEYLLVDESTTFERRQRIARLIGHETAHLWFGDWATIQWWKYLWLKEGFARFLEFIFVDSVFPNWHMWGEFLKLVTDEALDKDAVEGRTHPVQTCSDEPRSIVDSFDLISYGKGATTLRMLASIITIRRLRRCTHLLLTHFGQKSFNTEDFFRCICEAYEMEDGSSGSAFASSPMPHHASGKWERGYHFCPTSRSNSSHQLSDAHRYGSVEPEPCNYELDLELVKNVLESVEVSSHPLITVRCIVESGSSDFETSNSNSNISPHANKSQGETLLNSPPLFTCSSADTSHFVVSTFNIPHLTNTVISAYVSRSNEQGNEDTVNLLTFPQNPCFRWNPETLFTATPIESRTAVSMVPLVSGVSARPQFTLLQENHTIMDCSVTTGCGGNPGRKQDASETNEMGTGDQEYSVSGATGSETASGAASNLMPTLLASKRDDNVLLLLNYRGCGAMRCDYDHRTWKRIFNISPFLAAEDRITITMTLVRLRLLHLGQWEGEVGDRSTLFVEWLLTLVRFAEDTAGAVYRGGRSGGVEVVTESKSKGHQRCINFEFDGEALRASQVFNASSARTAMVGATLWGYLAEHVEVLVYLLRSHYCWPLFADNVVSALFVPLYQRGVVTFSCKAKIVDFDSQSHLSWTTVMRIMQVLAMCRCPQILEEARECVDLSLRGVVQMEEEHLLSAVHSPSSSSIPCSPSASSEMQQHHQHQQGGGDEFHCARNPASVASFNTEEDNEDQDVHEVLERNRNDSANAGSHDEETHSPDFSHKSGASRRASSETFDLFDVTCATRTSIAMQAVVEAGDRRYWWALSCVLGAILSIPMEPFGEALGLKPLQVNGQALAEQESATNTVALPVSETLSRWVNMIVPAVFIIEDVAAFPFLQAVVRRFHKINAPLAKSLLRNTTFLTALLEGAGKMFSREMATALIIYGSYYCASGTITTLLKRSLSRGDMNTAKRLEFMPSVPTTGGEDPLGTSGNSTNTSTNSSFNASFSSSTSSSAAYPHLSRPLRDALATMEMNSVWADYSGAHIHQLLATLPHCSSPASSQAAALSPHSTQVAPIPGLRNRHAHETGVLANFPPVSDGEYGGTISVSM